MEEVKTKEEGLETIDKVKMSGDVDFVELKEGQEPVRLGYRGKKDNFGRSNKSYKLYVDGLDNMEKEGLTEINFKTPKNRKMLKYILLVSKLRSLQDAYHTDLSLIDDLLDYIVDNYEVPATYLERANTEELFTIIAFGGMISASPS